MAFSEFQITQESTNQNYIKIDLFNKSIKGSFAGISFIDKDTKQYVSYIPALEISGYGDNREKAEEMIKFSMHELFFHLIHLSKGELDAEMRILGWKKNIFFNKQFSNAYIDMEGALQNFNVEENSVKRIKLIAA